MKTTLLTSLGFSLLAFASFGQTRQTGIPQSSIKDAISNQITQQKHAAALPTIAQPIHVSSMMAPCIDTLLFEDFQSQTIPAPWLNLDNDGLTDFNARPANWFPFQDLETTTPGDTNYVAASSSWFSPAGIANNVLILSSVQPCATTILRWSAAPFEGPSFADGYEVRISTTGTNIGDFTTTLFTAAESLNGTATQSSGTVHTSYNGNRGVLQNWEVSLGAYDNQTIYIAFFHDSNDDNLIMIDNIFMGTVVDFDLEVTSVNTERYYSTPLTQVTPRTFTAEIGLASGLDVTTPTSNVNLFQGATSVFTNAPSAPSLSAGNTVSLTTSAYTPLAVDTYQAIFTASAVETDPNLTNNMDSLSFVVSDSIYATENGDINGALSIGAGSTGFLGNQYSVVTTDDITSITFTLTAPIVGDTIVGAIYNVVGNVPTTIAAITDTLFVTSALQAEYTLSIAGGFATLPAGDYVVGLLESQSGALTLATNDAYYEPTRSWVFFGGNWDNNENFNFFNTYYMHANFGPSCPAVAAAYTESTNATTVSFTDASANANSWMWDFGDGNTSTLQNPSHTYAADGTYTVCLIAAGSCGADTLCTTVTVTSCVNPVASFTESLSVGVVDFTNTSTSIGGATYAWDFGDGNTSTLVNPSNTYAANGSYTACLTITDSCGVDSVCTTVNISTIGIEENNPIDGISIYPVPAQNQITVANLALSEDFKLELMNNLGQIVKVIQTDGMETIQWDLSTLVDGYYHLIISNSTVIGTRPVLIKH